MLMFFFLNRQTSNSSLTPRSGRVPYVFPSPRFLLLLLLRKTLTAFVQLNTAIGGDADSIYLVVADLGSPSGAGLDFINGYAWLERFYTVYVGMSGQLGVATTKYTNSTDN